MDGMMEWRSLRRAGAVRAPDMIDDRYRDNNNNENV